ncbi:hypothetical protein G9A89_006320 [Geosiphon pyriformis]|nr:hypothetical protein G9A89_006320 [Geosiphon pyriformis]
MSKKSPRVKRLSLKSRRGTVKRVGYPKLRLVKGGSLIMAFNKEIHPSFELPVERFQKKTSSNTFTFPNNPDDFLPNTMRGKHILVLGATGRLGSLVVQQALESSYHVTILVRNDRNLPFTSKHLRNPNLVTWVGSPLSRETLDQVVEGKDAVINCIGPSIFRDHDICSRVQKVLNESMSAKGVRRLIAITSQGCGDSGRRVKPIQHFFGRLFAGKIMDDKTVQEEIIIKREDLNWTIIRPGILCNGKLTRRYRINEYLTCMKVNRADVAYFIMAELRTSMWLKRKPTINGYKRYMFMG